MKIIRIFLIVFLFCGNFSLGLSQTEKPGLLKAGAAKVEITPAEDNLPDGYDRIHDGLFCRAVVLDNGITIAALVSVDQGMLSNEICDRLAQQIEQEMGIPALNIFISASHTHAAPWGVWPGLENGVIDAVSQANAKLQPARMSYNTGFSYVNINRDVIDPVTRLWSQGPNYDGPSDKTVAVIKFETLTGEPIAVSYNYAMHANTMFMSGAISADFPGEASTYIEDYFDTDVVALFSSGAAGDQNPISIRPMTDVGRKRTEALLASGEAENQSEAIMMAGMGGESNIEIDQDVLSRQSQMIASLGQILGEEVLRVMSLPQKADSIIQIQSSRRTITCPGRTRTDTGNREGQPGSYVEGDPVNIKLSLLRIGDVAMCGVNAEVYNIIAQKLKDISPLKNTVMATITNGASNSGYIPSDDAFQRYTFQVLSSRLKPNCAETSIINGLVEMIDETM